MDNEMTLSFVALSENESLARIAVTSFVAQLDPTIDELSEFKTIVSEAVSNAIIHGYDEDGKGIVTVHAVREGDVVSVAVKDQGKGIPDIKKLWSLYLRQRQIWNGLGWALPSWKVLQIIFKWNLNLVLERSLLFPKISLDENDANILTT